MSGDSSTSFEVQELLDGVETLSGIHRLTVSLHDLHPFSLHMEKMRELGWIGEGVDLAHPMVLADLRCVLELLENPIFLFDYLIERERLQGKGMIFGDELDWLALYLRTGLSFSELEEQENQVAIAGMSESIDQYYEGVRIGLDVTKPKPMVAPLWREVIDTLNSRKIPGHIDLGIDILRSSAPAEQHTYEKHFHSIEKSVRKNWRKEGHINAAMIVPPSGREAGLIFFAYPEQLHGQRRATAQNLAEQFFDQHDFGRCVVVGRNIDHTEMPYTFIFSFQAD